jgi:tRNA(Ile)-lysidine synthase
LDDILKNIVSGCCPPGFYLEPQKLIYNTFMLSLIKQSVQQGCGLRPDDLTVVGVSGGADSLCLMMALHNLGYSLLVAHFDHQIRADSVEDAHFVAEAADRLGVPFVLGQADVPGLAEREKRSLEEAARRARYMFLFEQARLHQAQAVAVAHTAEDQVETILMHLLRGSGLAGLKGMPWKLVLPEWDTRIPLVRPLLGVWRREVELFIQQAGLEPRHDPTNQDTTYFRNRLRAELIPYLESYNPQVRRMLWQTAQTLAEDFSIIEGQAEQAYQACLAVSGPDQVILKRAEFNHLVTGLRRRVARRAVAQLLPGLRDLDYAAVERALDLAAGPGSGGRADLVSGLSLVVEPYRLCFLQAGEKVGLGNVPQLPGPESLPLPGPGQLELGGGWILQAELLPVPPSQEQFEKDNGQAWLDAAALDWPLEVRGMRAGERFFPLGMGGRQMKLSDFFINQKIGQRARAGWPLVVSGEQVVWVGALRIAEPFCLKEGTVQVLHLRLFHKESQDNK